MKYIKKFKPEIRKCKFCDKEFEAKTSNQKYCSDECCTAFFKKRYTEEGLFGKGKYITYYKTRFEVLKRDNFTCQYCGRNVKEDKIKLMIDHIIPKSKGGTGNIDNLNTSCEECNLGKGDVLLSERIKKKEILNG